MIFQYFLNVIFLHLCLMLKLNESLTSVRIFWMLFSKQLIFPRFLEVPKGSKRSRKLREIIHPPNFMLDFAVPSHDQKTKKIHDEKTTTTLT